MKSKVYPLSISRQIDTNFRNYALYVLENRGIPSFYDGFGLAAAEAILFQIPVIGFDDCLGLTDFVKHDINGLLLPRTDDSISVLSNALLQLFSDSAEYDKLKRGCTLPSTYDPSYVCYQWEKMLNI